MPGPRGVPGPGWVPRPTTKGKIEGGSGPDPQPRGKLRRIWSRHTTKGEIEGLLTATAAGGMHPTGMHSFL